MVGVEAIKNPHLGGFFGCCWTYLNQKLAERTGLEPATLGVTGRYSNQLNYRSGKRAHIARSFDKYQDLIWEAGYNGPTFLLHPGWFALSTYLSGLFQLSTSSF